MGRFTLAWKSFWGILSGGGLPAQAAAALGYTAASSKPAPVEKATDGALRLMAALQAEGRLLDFLMEDISAYDDAQVGAAVRGLHDPCRRVLDRHLRLVPVIDGVEGTYTRVAAAGAGKRAVRLIGNVPPGGEVDGGILRHKGWRAERVHLAPPERGADPAILAPAELEVE